MTRSVCKSEEGPRAIAASYETMLADAATRIPYRRYRVKTALGVTHVIEAGDARRPPLVLLHGTASNAATWMADLPAFSRHFRVLAVDTVGEPGLSEDRRITLASDETSTWLTSLFDAVGIARVRIVGLSLGWWMGLHFATRFPERVEARPSGGHLGPGSSAEAPCPRRRLLAAARGHRRPGGDALARTIQYALAGAAQRCRCRTSRAAIRSSLLIHPPVTAHAERWVSWYRLGRDPGTRPASHRSNERQCVPGRTACSCGPGLG